MGRLSSYNPGIRSIDHKDEILLIGTRGSEIYEVKSEDEWTLLL